MYDMWLENGDHFHHDSASNNGRPKVAGPQWFSFSWMSLGSFESIEMEQLVCWCSWTGFNKDIDVMWSPQRKSSTSAYLRRTSDESTISLMLRWWMIGFLEKVGDTIFSLVGAQPRIQKRSNGLLSDEVTSWSFHGNGHPARSSKWPEHKVYGLNE